MEFVIDIGVSSIMIFIVRLTFVAYPVADIIYITKFGHPKIPRSFRFLEHVRSRHLQIF